MSNAPEMQTSYEQGSDAWRDARFRCVTGTDVGRILGVDTGFSRTKLLCCKREKKDGTENCGAFARSLMENGKRFEDTCRDSWKAWFEAVSAPGEDTSGFVPTMHADAELPWFTGSPDYILPGRKMLLECKTHFYPNITDAQPVQRVGDVKLKHYLQIQAYLKIMGYHTAYLCSWTLCKGYTIFGVSWDEQLWLNVVKPAIVEFKKAMDAESVGASSMRMLPGEAGRNMASCFQSLATHCARLY